MGFVVSGFALAILVVGAMGVASPAALTSFVRRWQTSSGIWVAAGLRIAFGVAAWSAAPASRTPVVLQVLGVVSIVSGIALPLLGLSRFAAVVSWWERRSAGFTRAWSGVACACGAFLLWSVIV
jgi:hypothetical protein